MKRILSIILIVLCMFSCKKETTTMLGRKIMKFKFDRKYENTMEDAKAKGEFRRNTINANTNEHDVFDRIKNIRKIKTLKSKETGIITSGGVYVSKDHIVVLNGGKSNIIVVDWDGNVIKTIGKVGSGNLEFNKPSAICFNNKFNRYYIYDSGNRRVVVLDYKFNFVENIDIKFPVDHYEEELGSDTDATSIAVDENENIYIVPYVAYSEKTSYLFKFSKNGEIQKLYDYIVGFLKMIDNKIYYVQNMEFYQFDDEFSTTMGHEYIYELKDDKLNFVAELPYKYYTDDIEIYNDEVYLYSSSWVCLDKFSVGKKLKYVETLTPQFIPPDYDRTKGYGRYMTTSRYKDKIVMADRFTGNIYIVEIDKIE